MDLLILLYKQMYLYIKIISVDKTIKDYKNMA